MRIDRTKTLTDAVVRFLNRCTLAMMPSDRRHWGAALIAEQDEISDPLERVHWAVGGLAMTAKDFLNNIFTEPLAWVASIAGGMLSAFVDLRSATRWPHILLLCSFGVILAVWRPKGAWRWTLLLAGGLPFFVLVTHHWGPYSVDRFDVFYGVVPATLGVLGGVLLRRVPPSFHHGLVE